jgi:cation diffusion facilitator family transporter
MELTKSRAAALSVLAAVTTLLLNLFAYWLTGSVGLLATALETLVNVASAVMTLVAVRIASRPADVDHRYGHGKVEDLSATIEGSLILASVVGIAYSSVERLLHPRPLEQVAAGLTVGAIAAAVNFTVARLMLRSAGKDSPAIDADAHHLLSDVTMQAGVLAGVGLVKLSGWAWLDPLVGLAVAAVIARIGARLIFRSGGDLLDFALPSEEQRKVIEVLERPREKALNIHALRTRKAGNQRFIDFHLVVPRQMSVEEAHALCEEIEEELNALWPGSTSVTIHVEPEGEERDHMLDGV